MKTLLLEIGAEEIPAGYLEPALDALAAGLKKRLVDAAIDCGEVRVMGTPRKLAVMVDNVATEQKAVSKDVMGPPKKVALDSDGNYTMAAKKFAERVALPVEALKMTKTEKGEYLCAKVSEGGNRTISLLPDILKASILSIPFPKTMKWADLSLMFARPLRSILALFGEDIIPFKLENVQSGAESNGHMFMRPEKILIRKPGDYVDALRDASVIVDLDERRGMVHQQVEAAAESAGGKMLPDEELLNTVKNLVEFPAAVAGGFDMEFLELPREILITAMREHQKYFAVVDGDGNLKPNFIAVNNTRVKDPDLVKTGLERVLRARLKDAQFFYQSDLEVSMDICVEKLKRVLFQAKLGSMYEKTERVEKLSEWIAESVSLSADDKDRLLRAARLCKADLVSQVVIEFPKLQGIMGRIYADAAGEKDGVGQAVEEHYRPVYSGGKLPASESGACLSIADKMDSICGCFRAGLIPTGASDPYALRRQGIGVVQILLERESSLSLKEVIHQSLKNFGETANEQEVASKVYLFLENRISNLLLDDGYSKEVIASVVSVSVDSVPNVWKRVAALQELKAAPDFEPLAVAFKRVVNIIRKSSPETGNEAAVTVDQQLFEDESEKNLLAACEEVKNKVDGYLVQGEFKSALLEIATLRSPVDTFFDQVMVMAEDEKIKKNRLALLRKISDLFASIADFSKL